MTRGGLLYTVGNENIIVLRESSHVWDKQNGVYRLSITEIFCGIIWDLRLFFLAIGIARYMLPISLLTRVE